MNVVRERWISLVLILMPEILKEIDNSDLLSWNLLPAVFDEYFVEGENNNQTEPQTGIFDGKY